MIVIIILGKFSIMENKTVEVSMAVEVVELVITTAKGSKVNYIIV